MARIVMKFGGTSVKDAEAFLRVAKIVASQKEEFPIVVTSAMAKVTDALLNAFELAKKGDSGEAFSSLEEHFDRHKDVAEELLDKPRQTAFLAELELSKEELSGLLLRVERRSLPLQMLKDAIVSYGEQLSSRLLAEVCKANELNARQVDSRRVIVTDDEYGSAKPIWDETEKFVQLELNSLQEAGEIPIMGGFIAANRSGETTTLGRGGSDYSAALVGAALQAKEIQIWTDVDGVYQVIDGKQRLSSMIVYECKRQKTTSTLKVPLLLPRLRICTNILEFFEEFPKALEPFICIFLY